MCLSVGRCFRCCGKFPRGTIGANVILQIILELYFSQKMINWANSADEILMIFFLFFPDNRL